jgi:16S rRNA (cytidine1402-2'-O)-methyltransferase
VIVVAPPPQQQDEVSMADLDTLLRAALDRLSLKEAVAEIVAITGEPRRMIYQRALALRTERDDGR